MPSFDVVSEVDKHVLTNAVDQAHRLITNRYDFKGVDASFERKEYEVTMTADVEFQLEQMLDVLRHCFDVRLGHRRYGRCNWLPHNIHALIVGSFASTRYAVIW